jgi:hypothetical protein
MTEYLANPYLRTPYLDWLMLDAMTSAQIVATLGSYAKEKHGIAYALSDGVVWKMFLWKLALRPLALVFVWVLPAVIFYFLARWSLPVAISVGVF